MILLSWLIFNRYGNTIFNNLVAATKAKNNGWATLRVHQQWKWKVFREMAKYPRNVDIPAMTSDQIDE